MNPGDGQAGARIPVFVLTGFLGAGKTSLMNALLAEGRLPRTGVVVNEYGEVGLDQFFLEAAGDSLVELPGGCLCCTNSGELAGSLAALAGHGLERIVIETSGLADPAPVLQSLMSDPQITREFEPAGVITLVDVLNGEEALAGNEEARQQAVFADVLVVTKTDLLPQGAGEVPTGLRDALRHFNPRAPIFERAEDLAALFDRHLFLAGAHGTPAGGHHHHDHDGHDHAHHDDTVSAVVLRHDRPMPQAAIEAFCDLLASAHGKGLLRIKGIVAIEESDRPLVVHGVGRMIHAPQLLARWPDADHTTRLVVIARDLDPALVERLFAGFVNLVLPDTPDRQALTDNPLAIPPGFMRR